MEAHVPEAKSETDASYHRETSGNSGYSTGTAVHLCQLSSNNFFLTTFHYDKSSAEVLSGAMEALSIVHNDFLSLIAGQGSGSITLEFVEKVAIISIANPTKRNAISGKMMVELAQIVVNTPQLGGQMVHFMTDALNRIRQCGLVSVCVINGPAVGGGLELTTTCDFRIMVNLEKTYAQSVHAQIGASLAWGGARRLTSIVGRKEAIRICAACIPVTLAEAMRIGFIDGLVELPPSGVCSDDELTAAGIAFLQPYTAMQYAGSVRAVKTAIASSEDMIPDESKCVERAMFEQRWYSADNISALSRK